MSNKEKLLKKLSDTELLELAKSLQQGLVDSRTTRSELIGILRDALSIEGIKIKESEINSTRNLRVRKRNQFLAVLVISLLAYSILVAGSASILNSLNTNELSLGDKSSRTYSVGTFTAKAVEGTLDNGYIIIGSIMPPGIYSPVTYILKTDQAGNMQWNITIPEQNASYVEQTSDGGYIIGGTSPWILGAGASWLVKMDSNGTVQWSNDIVGISNCSILSVRQTSDGGYIIAGFYTQYNPNMLFIAKVDHLGNIVWNQTYGEYDYAYAFYAQETSDGGYMVAGSTPYGVILVKADSGGVEQWNNTFGGTYPGQRSDCIEQTSDGGYIIVGNVTSEELWLGKIEQDGKVQWESTYSVNGTCLGPCVQQTIDGGYILAATTYPLSPPFHRSILLIKTDPAGRLQWESVYRKEQDQPVLFIQQRPDGGYTVAGVSLNIEASGAWLAEVVPEPPSDLPTIIPVALAISGLAVAICLILVGRKLKHIGGNLQSMTKLGIEGTKSISDFPLSAIL